MDVEKPFFRPAAVASGWAEAHGETGACSAWGCGRGRLRGLLLGLLLAVLPLAAQPRPVRVGFDRNYPPYEYVDAQGRPAGFDIDLIRAVAAESGLSLELRPGPWDEVRGAFERGELDVLTGMFATEEREKRHLFSIPHSIVTYAVFVRRGGNGPRSEAEFPGRRILVQQGDISWEYLRGKGYLVEGMASPEAALRALAAGRGDCAVLARAKGLYHIQKEGWRNLERVGSPMLPQKYCFAVAKDRTDLLATLNEGLFVLKTSGQLAEITHRHFQAIESTDMPFHEVVKRALFVLLPILALLLAVTVWNWLLRRLVARRTRDLRASEQKARAIFDLSYGLVALLSPDGTLLEINRSALEFSGVERAAVVGRPFWEGPWWAHSAELQARLREAIAAASRGEFVRFEVLHPSVDGSMRTVDFSLKPVKDEDGRVLWLIPEGRDMTERKRVEEALVASSQRMRLLVEQSPLAVIEWTPDFRVLSWNAAAETLFGYALDEVLGKSGELIVPPEELGGVMAQWRELLDQGGASHIRLRNRTRDGRTILCEWFNTLLEDSAGNCLGVASIGRDITVEAEAQRALEESERRFQKIFDESPFMMVLSDLETGRFVDVNQAYCRYMGCVREQMVGAPPHPDERFVTPPERERWKAQLLREGHLADELCYLSPSGISRTARLNACVLELGQRPHVLSILEDVTEQRQTEQDLKLLVDNIPCALYRCEAHAPWRMLLCSEGFHTLTGRPPAAFLVQGLTFTEIIHAEDLEQVTRDIDEGLARGSQYQTSYRILHADGTSRWVLDRGRVYRDPDGRPLWLDGVVLDISEKKAAELALLEQEERLRLVIEATGAGVMDWDIARSRWVYGEGWRELLGYAMEELPQSLEQWERIIHPDDVQMVHGDVADLLEKRAHAFDNEHRLRAKDGRWAWVHVRGTVVSWDPEGKPLRFIASVVDVSARRADQEGLEVSQATFSAIFRQAQSAMALSDWPEGRLLDVNEAWEELTGFSREDALGATSEALELFLDPEGRRRDRELLQAQGRVPNRELRIRRKDGGERIVLWSARIFRIGDTWRRVSSGVDITEIRQVSEALREAEGHLMTLFEGSPIGIFRSTPEGRFVKVNPAFAAMLRYADPSDVLEGINRVGIPAGLYEHAEQRTALVGDLLAHPGNWRVVEVRFRRKDGSFMAGIMSIILGPDPETGRPLFFGFVQDISERKRAEEALRASEERVQRQRSTIAELALDAAVIGGDLDSALRQIARTLAERLQVARAGIWLLSADEATLTGLSLYDARTGGLSGGVVLDTTGFPRYLEAIRTENRVSAEDAQNDPRTRELRDGYLFPLGITSMLDAGILTEGRLAGIVCMEHIGPCRAWHTDEESFIGNVAALIGQLLANAERRRAEDEVRHLKNYLSNIIDSMPAILVGLDLDGVITQWNRQAEMDLGVAAGDARGRNFREVMPGFAQWIEPLRHQVAQSGAPVSRARLVPEASADGRCYDLMLYPLVANGIKGAVVRIEDATERARIQELMVQTEKMMSVGGLAAGMAHEINNPLGIISQASQIIERRLAMDIPANRAAAEEAGIDLDGVMAYFQKRQIPQFIGGIQEAVLRCNRIVGNMLQFSRRSESVKTLSSLNALLEQALELAANDYDLKKKYDFRSIELVRDYREEVTVPVVPIEIEQVLLNLLKNAAQAMAGQGEGAPPRLVLRVFRESRYGVVEIEDNGPGMEESVRARIFEPFFTTKEPGVGTGLGLSVSYTIITQNHKGLLEVSSAPGQGACFTLRLPLTGEGSHG